MENKVIIQPVISEKSYALANSQNKYTFLVHLGANKIEIKKAVEDQYGVKVTSVNTTIRPGKLKTDWRYGTMRRLSDSKKAVVTLKTDDKIDDFFNI
jgi:large subunit ribosomal protein L23